MALRKKFLKSKPLCKVSFDLAENRLPEDAKTVELLGSFSNWEPIPMRKVKGAYTRTLDLETGSEYQFRYRFDGELWENDEAADSYIPNGISGDNSVVRL
ncbi:isoamylase early set domain-containing protein [Croceimicrobium hydrocarbonivorans]|uniref:Isoamylase early set domain-containing protein n=1 Tax=Croceimicrobium hydrocarbonivorans TaxID=2761580 RepID=A0A7H0VCF7_9FLAO|nr:isoamylase early set domain-containing protein [Croceimicrobium hydrocarbonivorans]QNR23405.1 isoamylase early set domain-containing protein [Croceimicrobium hydrocarbonivorans]